MKLWAFVFIALFAAVFWGRQLLWFAGRGGARRRREAVYSRRRGWAVLGAGGFHRGKGRVTAARRRRFAKTRSCPAMRAPALAKRAQKGRGQNATLANPSSPKNAPGLAATNDSYPTPYDGSARTPAVPRERDCTSFAGEQSKNS